MPITKAITTTTTRHVEMLTLQEYADAVLDEAYKQPLKTLNEALAVHGWLVDPLPDDCKPVCCGEPVECRSFLGGAYLAHCLHCRKFVYDVTGPSFQQSSVSFVDSDRVDLEADPEHRWIASVYADKEDPDGR
jgi:hypothetical protein